MQGLVKRRWVQKISTSMPEETQPSRLESTDGLQIWVKAFGLKSLVTEFSLPHRDLHLRPPTLGGSNLHYSFFGKFRFIAMKVQCQCYFKSSGFGMFPLRTSIVLLEGMSIFHLVRDLVRCIRDNSLLFYKNIYFWIQWALTRWRLVQRCQLSRAQTSNNKAQNQ